MIRSRFVRSFALVLTTFVALSCADVSPTAPPRVAPTQAQDGLISGLLGGVVGLVGGVVDLLLGPVLKVIDFQTDPNGIEVRAVKWAKSHAKQARSVSATIGVDGGTLYIPTSDFAITFPKGALLVPTAITITSDASGYVSYDMKPHGLTFVKPVIVTQRLRNTAVYDTPTALNSFGAYFPKDPKKLDGILKALEIEKTTIYGDPREPKSKRAEVQTWELNHFSRYMLASG
jgi:hypothetical protein